MKLYAYAQGGLALEDQGELVGVDGAPSPGATIAGDVGGVDADAAYNSATPRRPTSGDIAAVGDLGAGHALGGAPGVVGDGPSRGPCRCRALRHDGEVTTRRHRGPGDLGIEEPRVRPHHRRPEALGQRRDGPTDQARRLRARIATAITQIAGQHDTGFGPDHRVGAPDPLTGVVVGHALLAGPVDLDIGRIQVQRRAHAGQRLAALGIQGRQPPGHQRGVRGLDPREGRLIEALGPSDERRRRRDIGHRPQLASRHIGALVVQVNHEITAREHHLRHRQHQAPRPMPLPAGLDRPHPSVDLSANTQHPVGLGHQRQTRLRRQGGVVITDHHTTTANR